MIGTGGDIGCSSSKLGGVGNDNLEILKPIVQYICKGVAFQISIYQEVKVQRITKPTATQPNTISVQSPLNIKFEDRPLISTTHIRFHR